MPLFVKKKVTFTLFCKSKCHFVNQLFQSGNKLFTSAFFLCFFSCFFTRVLLTFYMPTEPENPRTQSEQCTIFPSRHLRLTFLILYSANCFTSQATYICSSRFLYINLKAVFLFIKLFFRISARWSHDVPFPSNPSVYFYAAPSIQSTSV